MSKDKKEITMEDFDNWLSECPVPYEQAPSKDVEQDQAQEGVQKRW